MLALIKREHVIHHPVQRCGNNEALRHRDRKSDGSVLVLVSLWGFSDNKRNREYLQIVFFANLLFYILFLFVLWLRQTCMDRVFVCLFVFLLLLLKKQFINMQVLLFLFAEERKDFPMVS